MNNFVKELVSYGDEIGNYEIYQLPYHDFTIECTSNNTAQYTMTDFTGYRSYSGCFVSVRLIKYLEKMLDLKDLTVVELGCGVGMYGILSLILTNCKMIVLTDGDEGVLAIAQRNANSLLSKNQLLNIRFNLLKWSITDEELNKMFCSLQMATPFNVVIGCELMYYQTDIQALVNTVVNLVDQKGLFIHAHLFRKAGQCQEFIDNLLPFDWITLKIPHPNYISREDLNHHPEWYRIWGLISTHRSTANQLLEKHTNWNILQSESDLFVYEDEDLDEECDGNHLLWKS